MKKLFLVLLTLALGLAPVMADQSTFSKPGTFTAQAGLGLYFGNYGGIDLEGGADFGLAQVPFSAAFPVDFGVAGRVAFGIGAYQGLAAGVFGTAHYSWKALVPNLEIINDLESYLGLGLRVLPGLAFDGYGGTAYHFDKNLAVFLENGYVETVLGISYRF